MIGEILVLVGSLLVLSKASGWVIEHAVVVARFLRVSELAIGFLLLAVATSLPELSVAVTGALTGNTGISVGNALGANIANIALVLGLTAFISPVLIAKREQLKLARILFATSFLPLIIVFQIGWATGVFLLAVFAGFSYFVLKENITLDHDGELPSRASAAFSGILLAGGVFLIIAGARFAVMAAGDLALGLGVSKSFVAATVISMGTTLPELSVAIAAVKKKRYGLVLGNVFGSCIVNLTLILGVAGVLAPLQLSLLPFSAILAFTLLISGILLYFIHTRGAIRRSEAMLLLGAYALFLLFAAALEAVA